MAESLLSMSDENIQIQLHCLHKLCGFTKVGVLLHIFCKQSRKDTHLKFYDEMPRFFFVTLQADCWLEKNSRTFTVLFLCFVFVLFMSYLPIIFLLSFNILLIFCHVLQLLIISLFHFYSIVVL
jgi:hypothetical protein